MNTTWPQSLRDGAARWARRLPRAESLRVLLPVGGAMVLAGLFLRPNYSVEAFLTEFLLVAVFAYAWNIVGGFLGEISFAHAVYWAIGAYTLVVGANAGLPFAVCLGIAVAVGAIAGALTLGFSVLARLDSFYWMIATILIVYITTSIARESPALGGAEGVFVVGALPLPSSSVLAALSVLAAIVFLVNGLIARSRRGQRWVAFRDDALSARVVGVRVNRERLVAYVISGALTAAGGVLAGAVIGFASPTVSMSIAPVVIAILAVYIGGPATVFGPLLGAFLLEGLNEASVLAFSGASPHIALLIQYVVAIVVVRFAFRRHTGEKISERGKTDQPEAIDLPPRRLGPPVLEVNGVTKAFGGFAVLKDVTFTVRQGEIVGLVGPNGAGKTTILNVLNGLIRPDTGTVVFKGEVLRAPAEELAHRGFVRTFQTPRVFESLEVQDSILITPGASAASTAEALKAYSLPPRRRGGAISLTQRKQLEQARVRAIEGSAKVVLLDEPLSGLDRDELQLALDAARAAAATGAAVVLVEHLIPAIAPVCDRMVVLVDGTVLTSGSPDEVLRDPAVAEAYLGSTSDRAKDS